MAFIFSDSRRKVLLRTSQGLHLWEHWKRTPLGPLLPPATPRPKRRRYPEPDSYLCSLDSVEIPGSSRHSLSFGICLHMPEESLSSGIEHRAAHPCRFADVLPVRRPPR